MSDQFLSQDELDALLKGLSNENENETFRGGGSLTDVEKDMIGEVGNISMGAAATALSTILGRNVNITTPVVEEVKFGEIGKDFSGEKVVVTIEFVEGLTGLNVLVLQKDVVAKIADIMMGGTGEVEGEEIDEIKLSAVSEAMNQMMGAAATAMSDFFKTKVDITPPKVEVLNFDDPNVTFPPIEADPNTPVVKVSFDLEIEGLPTSKFVQIMSSDLVKQMYEMFMKLQKDETEKAVQEQPATATQTQSQPQPQPQQPQPTPVASAPMQMPMMPQASVQQPVMAEPAQFQPLTPGQPQQTAVPPDKLELLFDVPLTVTVELGRTRMTLKQILELSVGSLIELDKLTGEPVDILVNGKLIARGEVVVIDENFGVRITEIVSPKERFYAAQ